MDVDVVNMKGKKVKRVTLPAAIFEAPVRQDLMHQALVRQLANARLGTVKTKGRGEVSGGGRKPWRQKGTGRARQGSTRSPQWRGGGKVHTPMPRDHSVNMPVKMRRAALRSALSAKAAEAQVVVVDALTLEKPSTSAMAEALQAMTGGENALLLLPQGDDVVERSVRNLAHAKTLRASYLNIRDLFEFQKLVVPLAALEQIGAWLDPGRAA
jgi:large subunit ribosomal protein L4